MKNNKGFSLIAILIAIGVIAVVVIGYSSLDNKGGVELAECQEYQDDVCGLFQCMSDSCWCNDRGSSPILFETYISFDNEQGAKDAVHAYIAELMHSDESSSESTKKMEITNVVKLNDVFYNVFVDKDGDEEVFTVSVDGQIITTICGI